MWFTSIWEEKQKDWNDQQLVNTSLDWEATACVGWLIDCDWLNDKQNFTVMVNATDLSWQRTLCPHVNKGRENSFNTWKNSFVELHVNAEYLLSFHMICSIGNLIHILYNGIQ